MRNDGRTDRHDEAKSRFPKFCERAYSVVVAQNFKVNIGDSLTCATQTDGRFDI